jgi:hypothetical protein
MAARVTLKSWMRAGPLAWPRSAFRINAYACHKPVGTYTYVLTRIDDPDWGAVGGGHYFTRRAALAAGRAALNRILQRQHGRDLREEPDFRAKHA